MSLGVGVVLMVLVLTPPIIWVAWWLLADLGEKSNGSYRAVHLVPTARPPSRAA